MTEQIQWQPLVCGSILLMLLGVAAVGQSPAPVPTYDVKGIVTDVTGTVIATANVVFERGSETVTAQTGTDGSVHLRLPSGHYVVWVSVSGFKTTKVTDFAVEAHAPAVLKVVLHPGKVEQTGGEGEPLQVPTQTSDLPNVIQPDSVAHLFMGGGSFTLYPPYVYSQVFIACSADKSCSRTDKFRVDPMPRGCCLLTVKNGDGRGTDEVRSYLVFLNGTRVPPAGQAQHSASAVSLRQDNVVRVMLTGEPYSKVFIQITYDPRQSK